MVFRTKIYFVEPKGTELNPAFRLLLHYFTVFFILPVFNTLGMGQENTIGGFAFSTIDFSSSNQTTCLGTCVNFNDQSGDEILEWNWSFPGSEATKSTDQNPSDICYNQSGLYDVKLVVKRFNGTFDSIIKTGYIEVLDTPKVNLGSDLTICSNITVQLDASIEAKEVAYLWQDGSTKSIINTTTPGMYTVKVNIPGCGAKDSIKITHKQAPVVEFKGFNIPCKGDTVSFINLDVTRPNATYLWDNGSVEGTRVVKGEGLYWVTVKSNGCETKKKLDLRYIPLPNLHLLDTVKTCENNPVILNVETENGVYKWDNGSTEPTKLATQGWNMVEVTVRGCSSRDSTFLNEFKLPVVNIGNDTALCSQTILLSVQNSGLNEKYLWSTGSITNETEVDKIGLVWLKVSNENCHFVDSLYVVECPITDIIDFHIPNVFSPNDDRINDQFFISNEGIDKIDGIILNRWGQVVFNWKGVNDGWDGYTIAGEKLPDGNYYYFFKIIDRNGREHSFKGVVVLMR